MPTNSAVISRLMGRGDERHVCPVRAVIWTVIISGIYVAIVLGIHATNPRTLVSTHGLLHAAIAQQCESATLPPENPFYAGETLCYYWFFQACAAGLARLSSVDVLHALEWLIAGSLVVLTASGVLLGARLYRSTAAGLLIGFLALVGANPTGPINYLIRSLTETHNVFRDDPNTIFGPYIYWSQVGARLFGPNLPYFLHITSRPVAIALLLVLVVFMHRALAVRLSRSPAQVAWQPNSGWLPLIGITVTAALATAFNPLIGLACGSALVGAMFVAVMIVNSAGLRTTYVRSAWPLAVAILLGMLAAAPTFTHMFDTSQGGYRVAGPAMAIKHLAAVVIGAGPLAWLAFRGSRAHTGLLGTNDDPADVARVVICISTSLAATVLLAGAIVASLPEGNEHNLFNAAIPLLAVSAVGGLKRGGETHRAAIPPKRMALVVLALAPHFVLLTRAYTGRAPINLGFDRGRIVRLPADSDLARLYQWINTETPRDAVFVTDPRTKIAMQGNVPELPAMTGRCLFLGSPGYLTDPYPDAVHRRDVAVALLTGSPLNEEDGAMLAGWHRPVFVVHDNMTAALQSELAGSTGTPVFQAGPVAVFRWESSDHERQSKR